MLYFKHIELAKKYSVSVRTVHNWIEYAKAGKLDLILHNEKDKQYVANTARNIDILTELSEKHRKYRNTKASKIISPKSKFYELFNSNQVHDIISNLEIYHEIPRQYNYFDRGAQNWKKYAERLATENAPNMLTSTVDLINLNQEYIDNLTKNHSRINIIDIGVGNSYPSKNIIQHLLDNHKLGRYIALDISPSMLEIAKQNIETWFGDKVSFEGYEYDVNYDRFSRLLASEYISSNNSSTANLVLLLGGTLSNMRYPDNGYRMIHDSMGMNDILIHSTKLDTETSRSYFDFNFNQNSTALSPNHRLIFDLLNIDDSFYTVEMGYNPNLQQRYIRVRLKIAITIKFKLTEGIREISFNKDDSILLWHGLQQTAKDVHNQFDRNDFYTLHSSQTTDKEYILTISKIRHD